MLQPSDKINGRLSRISQSVYLNLLWGGLVIAGLGVFTLGPVLYAMVTVIREWLHSKEMFPLTKAYFIYFKENYRETLLISWMYGAIGVVLFVDLSFIHNWYLRITSYIAAFIHVLLTLYIFPIMVHYDWKGYFFKMKMAFLSGFSHLHYSLALILSMAGIYLMIIRTMSGVLTFIGGSSFFSTVTWTANSIFCHLEWKNPYTEEIKESKNITKTVRGKTYEKSNARRIRS